MNRIPRELRTPKIRPQVSARDLRTMTILRMILIYVLIMLATLSSSAVTPPSDSGHRLDSIEAN